jgi:DNA mismatch endonuclease (patch repair protein)
MADVHEPEVRSYNMSQIKGKDTKPEIVVRKFLHSQGYRFRLHGKYRGQKLPGKPDLVLPRYKTVVFVQGCFWHGHEECRFFKIPKTNTNWWKAKIDGNRERDRRNHDKLQEQGWNVISVWECDIKDHPDNALKRIVAHINQPQGGSASDKRWHSRSDAPE